MAGDVKNLLELARFLKNSDSILKRSVVVSLMKTSGKIHRETLIEARKQFIGRMGRRLSGRLFNAIFTEVKIEGDQPVLYSGTRGIPYGRIHEYGGTIYPKPENKMQKLWIPNPTSPAKRMTPREFIRSRPGPLSDYFLLADKSEIPERPYIRPGLEHGFKDFQDVLFKTFEQEAGK